MVINDESQKFIGATLGILAYNLLSTRYEFASFTKGGESAILIKNIWSNKIRSS